MVVEGITCRGANRAASTAPGTRDRAMGLIHSAFWD